MSDEDAAVEVEGLSRVDHLREILAGLTGRMRACKSDQNFAVMASRRMEVLAELDELDPEQVGAQPETGLSEFERKLHEREQSA